MFSICIKETVLDSSSDNINMKSSSNDTLNLLSLKHTVPSSQYSWKNEKWNLLD